MALLFSNSLNDLPEPRAQQALQNVAAQASGYKHLLFYNKPPKTGSTSVRIAMSLAAQRAGLVSANCFKMTEWNELGLRTLIQRQEVDFYGCHTRLFRERFTDVVALRGGNVTFMTNTRAADRIVLSAYLQKNRHRNIARITDAGEIRRELAMYREYVAAYPVDALYRFHGGVETFTACPHRFRHEAEMHRLAARYEVVVDLERPAESAAIVQAVTGLTPDFGVKYNERTADLSSPMLTALAKVDTSHKSCGNELVHKKLKQQYNVIKDRLMGNGCFDEEDGSYDRCEKTTFKGLKR